MSTFVWRIWRLAWVRRDCVPYGGEIYGWKRVWSRLYRLDVEVWR